MPFLVVFLVLAVAVPAWAQSDASTDPRPALGSDSESGAAQEEAVEGIPYEVAFAGELPKDLRDLLDEVSQLEEQAETRLPATPAALRRRVEDERKRLEAALQSAGYYDFELETEVDAQPRPAQVTIRVETGPQFTLGAYEIVYRPGTPEPPPNGLTIPTTAEDLDLEIGMPAQAKPMKAAEERIVTRLARAGYPYASVGKTRYVADHATSELSAEVVVETGPRAQFGPLTLDGLESVEPDYIRRIAEWPEGELWDRRQMENVRQRLADTNLFSTVVLDYADEAPAADGPVPVEAILRERDHRTIGLGAGITSSDDYVRGTASWEHRNLFGQGENLELGLEASLLRQEARAAFRKPNFFRIDQTLIARAALKREDSDAFDETTAATSVGVSRAIGGYWTVELNLAYEFTEQTDTFGTDRFSLVGLPAAVTYDRRDSILNPTEGFMVSTAVTPWTSIGDRNSEFVVGEIFGSTYWSPFEEDRVVFAGRARYGSLFFENVSQIPASKRFYAGGGGSVRGYDFRSIGPLDDEGDPIGGKSAVEVGLEARIKLTDTIGIVPFVDGGQVYSDTTPELDFDWQWAAGLGFRYYLGIGPVRLDVAVPINPRDRDDYFEFYLSIGQAF